MKLAVRAPNWLGDCVMALPALEALRNARPEDHLVVVARTGVADLFRLSGLCDEVVTLPSPHGDSGWSGTFAAARSLREHKFDAGLLFPNSLESVLVFRAAGIRNCWGYARDGRGLLLRKRAIVPAKGSIPRHEVFYYLELLRQLQIIEELPALSAAIPTLHLDAAEKQRGREALAQAGFGERVIALSPGAANSRAKQWGAERYVEVGKIVAERHRAEIAVFGTPQETELAESIAGQLRTSGVEARSLAGKTSLADFIRAISQAGALITNDSGGMHVAYAAGVPTVAIFGPTIESETGPIGPHTKVVREPVECSPCMLKDCPIDHRCMTRVHPERVAGELENLVQLR